MNTLARLLGRTRTDFAIFGDFPQPALAGVSASKQVFVAPFAAANP